jgi:hypothetical protein
MMHSKGFSHPKPDFTSVASTSNVVKSQSQLIAPSSTLTFTSSPAIMDFGVHTSVGGQSVEADIEN